MHHHEVHVALPYRLMRLRDLSSACRKSAAQNLCLFRFPRPRPVFARRGQRFPVRRTVCWIRRDRCRCVCVYSVHCRRRICEDATPQTPHREDVNEVRTHLQRTGATDVERTGVWFSSSNDQIRFWVSEWWLDYRTEFLMLASYCCTIDAGLKGDYRLSWLIKGAEETVHVSIKFSRCMPTYNKPKFICNQHEENYKQLKNRNRSI